MKHETSIEPQGDEKQALFCIGKKAALEPGHEAPLPLASMPVFYYDRFFPVSLTMLVRSFLMKKSLFPVLLVLCLVFPLASQAAEKAEAESAEAAAWDLLEASGLTQLSERTVERLLLLRKKAMPNIPDHFWEDFKKEVDPNELNKLILPIYVKHFSVEEMKALTAFYRSDVGRKFLAKIPNVTRESMQVSRDWNAELRLKLTKMLKKADLKKKE